MDTGRPLFGLFRVSEMSTGRIEAFSDGVFSIVMTLLVLEIHVPSVTGPNVSFELARNLFGMMSKFFSYALSFTRFLLASSLTQILIGLY